MHPATHRVSFRPAIIPLDIQEGVVLDVNALRSSVTPISSSKQHRFSTHVSGFDDLIDRVSVVQREHLATQLDKLQNCQKQVNELHEALEKGFNAEIFYDQNLPYYALEALNQQKIERNQFGTIQLFWSIGQYHQGFKELRIISLFNSGLVDKQARELIVATFTKKMNLNEQQLKRFYDLMALQPLSEQQFFLVPDIQENSSEKTLSQRINSFPGPNVNLFCRPAKGQRMIPSLGMMQCALIAMFGDEAVIMNPVLGASKNKHMRQIQLRDFALHYPGIELPSIADTFPAPWYDFSWHDFYHGIRASTVSPQVRKLFVKIADSALELMHEMRWTRSSPEGQTMRALNMAFLDMEFSYFHLDLNIPSDEAFYLEIEKCSFKILLMNSFEFCPEAFYVFATRLAEELMQARPHLQNEIDAIQAAKKSGFLELKDVSLLDCLLSLFQGRKRPFTILDKALLRLEKGFQAKNNSKYLLEEVEKCDLPQGQKDLLRKLVKEKPEFCAILLRKNITFQILGLYFEEELRTLLSKEGVTLVLVGLSLNQIIANAKMIGVIIHLLKMGVPLERVISSSVIKERTSNIKHYIDDIASFEQIDKMSIEQRERLSYLSRVTLFELFVKVGKLDKDKFHAISNDQLDKYEQRYLELSQLMHLGFSTQQIITMNSNLYNLLVMNSDIICRLLNTMDLKQFGELSYDRLAYIIANWEEFSDKLNWMNNGDFADLCFNLKT